MDFPGLVVVIGATDEQLEEIRSVYRSLPIMVCDEGTTPADIRKAAESKPFVHCPTRVMCFSDLPNLPQEDVRAAVEAGDECAAVRYATMVRHADRFVSHAAEHIVDLALGRISLASDLVGSVDVGVGIAVGAGPSLEAVMPDLVVASQRCTVAVSDTAVRFCMDSGVDIDFACTLDSSPVAAASIPTELGDLGVPVVYGPQTDPAHVRRLQDAGCPCYMAPYPSGPIGRIWQRLGVEMWLTGGSVGTGCYTLLAELGAHEIRAVGLDCCYAPGGATHAASVGISEEPKNLRALRGRDGGLVTSTQVLDHYRRWLEMAAHENANRIKHVNCSVGGAYIGGWQNRGLLDAVS